MSHNALMGGATYNLWNTQTPLKDPNTEGDATYIFWNTQTELNDLNTGWSRKDASKPSAPGQVPKKVPSGFQVPKKNSLRILDDQRSTGIA